jgi:hypothetical protein
MPATTISTAATMKAPTATGKPPSGAPVATNSTAPGVDHATVTGIRVRKLRPIPMTPMTSEITNRPEAASGGDAPTAANPARTIGTELA